MVATGDWISPRVNRVPYFDKPPLLYWLMALGFSTAGPSPFAARFWSALAAVGAAVVTARVGTLLGGPRLGLLAGLMTAANLGMFLFGRIVKPDLVFILCLILAFAGFVWAYRGAGRWALVLFYAALGLATMAKDVLGALGPLAVVALFLALTRERPLARWFPWWGVLVAAGIALPWYLAVEAGHRGFLWYTIVDNHLLNFTRQRVFPDEDVPLGALEFLAVTIMACLPWALAVPWGVARALRRPAQTVIDRLWLLFALWGLAVVGFFTLSPFKLPHYALPAFPALALLAARAWDESIEAAPGAPRPRVLLVPVLVLFAVVGGAFAAARLGVLPLPPDVLASVDLPTRNLAARGQAMTSGPAGPYEPVLLNAAIVFGLATVAMAVAVWRRAPALGVGVALGAMLAFLPIAGEGMTHFARSRSVRPLVEALAGRAGPGDLIVHEGALENSGSLLLALRRPVQVVDGLRSNLAFGSTFPEARDVFWDGPRLRAAWAEPGRKFLISAVPPDRSVARSLPPERLRLLAQGGGRWLYANVAD